MLTRHHSLMSIKKSPHSFNKIFSRLSEEDYSTHPELKQIVNYKRKAGYEFLTKDKTKPISTKSITDEKRFSFIQNLNAFRQHYSEYSKEEEKELLDYNKVHKENEEFTAKYTKVFKSNNDKANKRGPGIGSLNCLNDIQVEYDKNQYKVPQMSAEHNIFKENPLLLGNADLYKYYFFQRGNSQTEKNSYGYLNRLNDQVFNKATAKKDPETPEDQESPEKAKYFNLLLQDIQKNKNEIQKTTMTLENIDTFDDFFITKHNFNIKKSNCVNNNHRDSDILVINQDEKASLQKESSRNCLPLIPCKKKTSKISLHDNSFTNSNNHFLMIELDKIENGSRKGKSVTHTRSPLESLYEDTHNIELRNTPFPAIKEYFNSQRLYIQNDHSTKGMYRQLQLIKDKFLKEKFLNENMILKGHKQGAKNISEVDQTKITKTKNLEKRLLLNENLFIKIAFQSQK